MKLNFILYLILLSGIVYGNKFDWKLKSGSDMIHIGKSNIQIIINDTDGKLSKIKNLSFISDKQNSISAKEIYRNNNEIFVSLKIKNHNDIVGKEVEIQIINLDTEENQKIGTLRIPIGSDAPFIHGGEVKHLITQGDDYKKVTLEGSNLMGIIGLISSDNKLLIDEIMQFDQLTKNCIISVKSNVPSLFNTCKVQCIYKRYSKQGGLITDTTKPFELGISLIPPEVVEFKTIVNTFYLMDIVSKENNRLSLDLHHTNEKLENFTIISDSIISSESVLKKKDNKYKANLVLKLSENSSPQVLTINLKNRSEPQRKYKIVINLIADPQVNSITNKKGNLNFVITDEFEQQFRIKGKDLIDVIPVAASEDKIKFTDEELSDNLKSYRITFPIPEKLNDGTYRILFKKKNNITFDTADIIVEKPRIPQPITELIDINCGNKYLNGKQSEECSRNEKVYIAVKHNNFDPGKGEQSIDVEFHFYNDDGTLIKKVTEFGHGFTPRFKIKKASDTVKHHLELIIPNYYELERPWGYVNIIFKHTNDFYRQAIDTKEPYAVRIRFKRTKISPKVTLTIPPVIFIGNKELGKVETLPLNIGGGVTFDVRKKNYQKSIFSFGSYFAGLNFLGEKEEQVQSDDNESDTIVVDSKSPVNKGDIAFLFLTQLQFRKVKTFDKTPLFLGLGVPLKKDSKPFVAFGVGLAF